MNGTENSGALDKSIADSFPASDPPSQTQPVTATPTQPQVPLCAAGVDELRVYRVIEPRQASHPFSGPGADGGGRWTSPGTPGVYASLSPATAMLEYLVHLEGEAPDELLLAQAAVPGASVLVQVDLPSNWMMLPYQDAVRHIGDEWATVRRSLALRVPSAICVDECNMLLNPDHPEFAKLRLDALTPIKLDPRLRI